MKVIEKRWGQEIYLNDHAPYQVKRLIVNPGKSTSLHYHNKKHETLIVVEGELRIEWMDESVTVHPEGNVVPISPGEEYAHRMFNEGDIPVKYIECSTPDFDAEDNVRVRWEPGHVDDQSDQS